MANYEIVKKIAVLGGKPDGVTKEINIVKWGVYDPMIDIRREGEAQRKRILLRTFSIGIPEKAGAWKRCKSRNR